MVTPTVERPDLTPTERRPLLPRTRIGQWALGLQVLAIVLAVCWPPLGRALGHWGAWGMALPIALVGVVIGTGGVAIFRAKERSLVLRTLYAITTVAFVLVGLLILAFAVGKPDINPSQ